MQSEKKATNLEKRGLPKMTRGVLRKRKSALMINNSEKKKGFEN